MLFLSLFAKEINLLQSAYFWIGMIFVPVFTLLPDFFYKSLQRTMYKSEAQAIQEKEAKNEDIEPLIRKSKFTETARLIKSAFSFSRSTAPPAPYRNNINILSLSSYMTCSIEIIFNSCLAWLTGGFAFSQEENGAVKQSELIRKYDTNIEKPTGE